MPDVQRPASRREIAHSPVGRARRVGLALLCALLLLHAPLGIGHAPSAVPAASAQAAPPPYRVERLLSLPVGAESEVALSGTLLLWTEGGAGGPGSLAGLDLRTGRRLPLPTPGGIQRQPALAGTLAAWIETDPATERPQLVAYDLDAQRRTVVTGPAALPDRPAIDGTTLVWRDRRGGDWAIYGHDLVDGREYLIAADAGSHGPPAVGGGLVAWSHYRGGSWDVEAFDLPTAARRTLAGGPGDQVNPRVAGGRVLYEDRAADGGPPSLRLLDPAGGAARTLVGGHHVAAPALAGGLAVWEDWRDGVAGIVAYDLARNVTVPVARAPGARAPVVDGRSVGWLVLTPVGATLAVAALRPVLPTERRDPPLMPDPNVLYFPETGQTLGYGFKGFWQQHGGLPVFGYPLTGEFREAVEGGERTVQYFERFRLEHNAAEPDPAKQVMVGRLGAEWLAGREPARLPPLPDTAGRRYFPQTGHTLAAGFKEYWEEHDGLRLLGYPITEETDEGGRTVQYFERGRLEVNPAVEDERFRIVAGQLGREALVTRGWLPGAARPTPPAQRPR